MADEKCPRCGMEQSPGPGTSWECGSWRYIDTNNFSQTVLCESIAKVSVAKDARIAELTERVQHKDLADGCLHEVAKTLKALGCGCGPDAPEATSPMMYPEWIACVVAHHKAALAEALKRLRADTLVASRKTVSFIDAALAGGAS